MPEGKGIGRLYLQKKPWGIPCGQKKARFNDNEKADNGFDYPSDSKNY
jgi:hypothetical protein